MMMGDGRFSGEFQIVNYDENPVWRMVAIMDVNRSYPGNVVMGKWAINRTEGREWAHRNMAYLEAKYAS